MSTHTNFGQKHKSVNQWLAAYENGDFHLNDIESIKSADWIMWECSEKLESYMEGMYQAIKMVKDTGRFNPDETFVSLKEVPVFDSENYNYANVIFSQDPNMLPVLIITPDKKGRSELFLISNKYARAGTMQDINEELLKHF